MDRPPPAVPSGPGLAEVLALLDRLSDLEVALWDVFGDQLAAHCQMQAATEDDPAADRTEPDDEDDDLPF